MTDKNKIEEILTRGVKEVLVKKSLEKRLLSGKKLRVKLGIDPTGSVLHLGHAVVLRKLREFQDLGHQVIFLIGDFTARIGDPTGRVSSRPPMSGREIKSNMKNYISQAGKILDIKKVEIRYNLEWLNELSFAELIELTSKITYSQVAQRADFKKRIKSDVDLTLQEFMYPVMQGYDSVHLNADVEIGGTDQKFNLLMGRQLQKRYKQAPQDIITCPLLEGLYGKDKMSKSLNNYISLTENEINMYGQIMSLEDNLIPVYFNLCTNMPISEVYEIENKLNDGKTNPRDLKMKLAYEIVRIYHGEKKAKEAQAFFVKTVQKKETPDELPVIKVETQNFASLQGINIVDLLIKTKLVNSRSEARRLIEQGGIKVGGKVIEDINKEINITKEGVIIQRGKRQFVKVIK
ncbi:tyrosine--tRNA ligase [Candidatus Falkowbacteria bacterium CG_4_9_14_3_um_filter_36_9]|uniref:Tyrosine--tRNA ligase n=2 Tax=Candidatus Falkowiibacteriota TaxID=1752728 RepID=A0A1J4TBZ4_9BACT|nr:MAG: tyrosine--tRNA ligase [Candidatus Falkowbacteria bacterium CG1_02_37_44]PIV51448.1 MAG: tyrosine--tRNA ligase [Candidatus Falkowbacteria bacterium CG02_land_8_20_14_3_00_36_14]PIX12323.1 MAG: tyrosine--tRNA ligase [Candidatus Falkowbacteria bacterium CG_4_8_14_3_um_filter_36_11]PJA11244.1 MAG: tyrosine--tRNA ligase [Candidatus Falkowbacteria bacterium CG_4_10_14_0_2_um_filter_36_22]PJB19919.1 MAG: tyrosine--tRNA ligase [Candidatus Falkowbacteria bacterium CG_4_9_14_3_um_filter_36_9]